MKGFGIRRDRLLLALSCSLTLIQNRDMYWKAPAITTSAR